MSEQTKREPLPGAPVPREPEDSPSLQKGRRPYTTPRLIEWGAVEDLTQGFAGPPGDDLFTGTVT